MLPARRPVGSMAGMAGRSRKPSANWPRPEAGGCPELTLALWRGVLDSRVVLDSSVVLDRRAVLDSSVVLDRSVVLDSSVVLDRSAVLDSSVVRPRPLWG